jgi:carboxymethylenebutenolidase
VKCGLIALTVLMAAVVLAAPGQAAVKTEMASYKSGSETISGYLALPGSAGRHPAIIVIHEWWGLNDWVKEQAEKFAGLGYVALAVDLYRGRSTADPDEAHELMRGLPDDRAVRDLKAAFDYLASRPDVDADKIGDVGWCMGGGKALLLAENESRLAACAVNYGALPTEPATIVRIQAPVLGNFGALDRGIAPDDVHAFEKAMQTAGKKIDVKIYEGAPHAFENPNNKAGYRPQAAADAWTRMVSFFAATLK